MFVYVWFFLCSNSLNELFLEGTHVLPILMSLHYYWKNMIIRRRGVRARTSTSLQRCTGIWSVPSPVPKRMNNQNLRIEYLGRCENHSSLMSLVFLCFLQLPFIYSSSFVLIFISIFLSATTELSLIQEEKWQVSLCMVWRWSWCLGAWRYDIRIPRGPSTLSRCRLLESETDVWQVWQSALYEQWRGM